MLYYTICDLIPFNIIVWYNSYFHMLYHIIHNVIPLFVTVYRVSNIVETYNHPPPPRVYYIRVHFSNVIFLNMVYPNK